MHDDRVNEFLLKAFAVDNESKDTAEEIDSRITDYLIGGGLFNPELANHDAVRELIIDARYALESQAAKIRELESLRDGFMAASDTQHHKIRELEQLVKDAEPGIRMAREVITELEGKLDAAEQHSTESPHCPSCSCAPGAWGDKPNRETASPDGSQVGVWKQGWPPIIEADETLVDSAVKEALKER